MTDRTGWDYLREVRDLNLGTDEEWITLKPALKAVLMAYAARANAQGVSWPGPKRLRLDTGLSRSTVYVSRNRLIDLRLIEVIERRSPRMSDVMRIASNLKEIAAKWSPDEWSKATTKVIGDDLPSIPPVGLSPGNGLTNPAVGIVSPAFTTKEPVEQPNLKPFVDEDIDGSVGPERQTALIAEWDGSDDIDPHTYSLIELRFLWSVGRLGGMESYLGFEPTPRDVPIVKTWDPGCLGMPGHPELSLEVA
jgi:hypothetical protein